MSAVDPGALELRPEGEPLAVRVGQADQLIDIACIEGAAHDVDVLPRHRPPSIPFDLGAANGEPCREFHEAQFEAATFEDVPGKWQAAILEAEQSRPKLHVVTVRDD